LSKQKLIKQLEEKNPQLRKIELNKILDFFTNEISNILKNGNNLEIRGLGRWYSKKLKENFNARNPATNEIIYKPDRLKVKFKASKKLNKMINE
jgi:nucleoid DNA-binding protein